MDALAKEGEEGRGKLRKASRSRKQAVNRGSPNLATSNRAIPINPFLSKVGSEKQTLGSEPSQYREEKKANAIPRVAASETG